MFGEEQQVSDEGQSDERMGKDETRKECEMKLLLTTVAAIGLLASVAADAAPYYYSAPRTAPAPARLFEPQQPLPEYWECGLIQVSPPDHDRDPGIKINCQVEELGD